MSERPRRGRGPVIVMERPDGTHLYREVRDGENGAQVVDWLLDCFDHPTTWTWWVRTKGG